MIDRKTMGGRIREVRSQRGMTLKETEEACGLSSTHLSEIERGRTSPTISALLRLADALGTDPSYFMEATKRPGHAVTSWSDGDRGGCEASPGVVGGQLQWLRIALEPGGEAPLAAGREATGFVLEGRVRLRVGEGRATLGAGDSFHDISAAPGSIRNEGSGGALVFVIVAPRALV